MIRQDTGWVADLRFRLLDHLGATGPEQGLRLLRRSGCSFLERQPGSGRHFGVVAEGRTGAVGMGSLETLERLPHPRNLSGKEGYALNVYVELEARGNGHSLRAGGHHHRARGRRTAVVARDLRGARNLRAAGFESRSFEEMPDFAGVGDYQP
jgi:hypothetical protein